MSRSNLLTWTQLLIAVLAIFTLLGDRISKLVIGLKGVSIEQQVEAFQSDMNKIEAISTIGHPVELESLIDDSTHLKHNVWARLIMYRMVMRALLRRLCIDSGQGDNLSNTPSLKELIRSLENTKVINNGLSEALERIRYTTHIAEWGTGTPPTDVDIRYVLNNSPTVLIQLQKLIKK